MELPPARTIPKCPEVKVTSAEELTKVKLWVGEFEEVTDQIALEVNELLQHVRSNGFPKPILCSKSPLP